MNVRNFDPNITRDLSQKRICILKIDNYVRLITTNIQNMGCGTSASTCTHREYSWQSVYRYVSNGFVLLVTSITLLYIQYYVQMLLLYVVCVVDCVVVCLFIVVYLLTFFGGGNFLCLVSFITTIGNLKIKHLHCIKK